MSDINLQIKVRNGRMLNKMRACGYESAADLNRACGVSQGVIGQLLNFKMTPLTKDGDYRPSVMKVCEALNAMPSDIFPDEMLTLKVDTNIVERELTINQLQGLGYKETITRQIESKELDNSLHEMMRELPDKMQFILSKRNGFEGEPLTYRQLGKLLNVSCERVRQQEAKALKMLRHPQFATEANKKVRELYQ